MTATLETRLASRVIRASAGTGKTFRLSNRFIALLAAGEPASSLLATTFTRAAAGEILDRVLSKLASAATEGADGAAVLGELREHAHVGLTRERCEALAASLARELHRVRVLTIDSLFVQSASALSLDLDAPPGWTIASDEEAQTLALLAADDAIRSAERAELIELLTLLASGGPRRSVHGFVVETALAASSAARSSERAAWEVIGPDADPPSDGRPADLVARLEEPPEVLNKSGSPNKIWANAFAKLASCARAGDWSGAIDGGPAEKLLAGEPAFGRVPIEGAAASLVEEVVSAARRALTAEVRDRNRATRTLCERFDAALEAVRRRRKWYSFDDVPRLLRRAGFGDALADLYYRLDASVRHLLLDEFQDTSRTQFELLEPIVDELLGAPESGGAIPRSVFCVGDVKQSLYGWREAEPELLENMHRRWPQLGEPERMDRSFRSSPAVIDAVNRVFGALPANGAMSGDPSASAAARVWAGRFAAHTAHQTGLPGVVRLRVSEPEAGEDGRTRARDRERAAIDAAARLAADAVARDPDASVAILFRRNKLLPIALEALRELGVDASERGGSPLDDAPAVAAVLSLLHLAQHPRDSAAAFHVGTSPLGRALGVGARPSREQRDRLAAEVRERLLTRGAAPVIAELRGKVAACTDERGVRRLGQLVALAREHDADPARSLDDLVRTARTRRVEDPARSGVRLVSVHGSKGLEFDTVILPDLDQQLTLRDRVAAHRDDPLGPVTIATHLADKQTRSVSPELTRVYDAAMERRIGEELCVLYVAMTRAKRRLELVIAPSERAPDEGRASLAKIVRAALAPVKSAEPGAVLWSHAHTPAGARERECAEGRVQGGARAGPSGAAAPRVVGPPRFARPGPGQTPTARLRRRSPSSLNDAGRIDLSSIVAPRPAAGAEAAGVGSAVHRWFERIGWLERGADPAREFSDAGLIAEARVVGVSEATARSAIERFRAALAAPAIRELLDRVAVARAMNTDPDALELRTELPFAVRDDGAELLVGRIDRLVVARDGAGAAKSAWVIDFKTDAVGPGEVDARAESLGPQVGAYRRAVGRLFGLPPECVRGTLAFLTPGIACGVGGGPG